LQFIHTSYPLAAVLAALTFGILGVAAIPAFFIWNLYDCPKLAFISLPMAEFPLLSRYEQSNLGNG